MFKTAPILEEYEVYNKLKNKKIKNSIVPGDIPPKLKKEFLPEFSFPVTNIFNSITKTGDYPRQWVTEYVTPIPKVIPPESEDDLRNISLTADLSKNYEQLLAQWLMPYIQKRIDPGQFGGLNGHSTNHYLISLFNFILKNTDTSTYPKAVIVALIDFSKAFNRIDHNKVIIRLSDWGVPGWILRILVSYLSKRSMILKYKGKQSMKHLMPGGSPQGTLLGVLLYLVYVNDIGMDLPPVRPSEPGVIDLPSCAFPPPAAISETEARLKFVDDLTVGECVRLDKKLQQDKNVLVLPPDQSVLQRRLNDIHQSISTHDMKINLSKSKTMIFNFSRNFQFEHTLCLEGTYLNPVTETKLLGLTITNNCKWDANTKAIVEKGNKRLWFLRRLKLLGGKTSTLLDIYKLFCRPVLEYGSPVWSGAISKKNKQQIERVQKNAFRIIFGYTNKSYESLLEDRNEISLDKRRDQLALKFAKGCLKSEKFNSWFPTGIQTRNGTHFYEPESKTKRLKNSAIPYMTRLLNKDVCKD